MWKVEFPSIVSQIFGMLPLAEYNVTIVCSAVIMALHLVSELFWISSPTILRATVLPTAFAECRFLGDSQSFTFSPHTSSWLSMIEQFMASGLKGVNN